MKKARARNRPSRKTRQARGTLKTVSEYLARIPEPARRAVNQIRAAIRSAVPEEATEIISYGIPAFKHKRG